jgi:hypothetical protein
MQNAKCKMQNYGFNFIIQKNSAISLLGPIMAVPPSFPRSPFWLIGALNLICNGISRAVLLPYYIFILTSRCATKDLVGFLQPASPMIFGVKRFTLIKPYFH